MALEPGKDDDIAQSLLELLDAKGIVLIVRRGAQGSGVSVKSNPTFLANLPAVLRQPADSMEGEVAKDLSQMRERNCPHPQNDH